MTTQPTTSHDTKSADETAVRALYQRILDAWNRRSGDAFAAAFAVDGSVVGFDGSQMTGREEIAVTLRQIFADHATGAYVGKVRSVRFLAPEAALLHAVAGVTPAGQSDLNPQLNTIQMLVAVKRAARLWGVAETLRQSIGARAAPASRATHERLMGAVRAQLGEAAFDAAWAAGQATLPEQAILDALRAAH